MIYIWLGTPKIDAKVCQTFNAYSPPPTLK